ncbi:MAG TPA: PKD domain-containing protein, partial [Actinotalea sp.]|nr:PKD domain-containing protein [Actinotalea sp.]
GTVQLSDGATPLGTVSLNAAGTATLTTSALSVGTHPITATFSGTATVAASSGSLTQLVEPVADAGGPYLAAEGAGLTLDGSGSTPGATYAWDVNGDGDFTDATGLAPTLTWSDLEALGIDDGPASHTVVVQVTIDAQTSTSPATTLDVTNTAPEAVVTGSRAATVGQPFTVKVGAHDPSSADMAATFTYTVDWGDGSPVVTLTGPADPPVTHTYRTAGLFSASFTATDKDGGVSVTTVIEVRATAPAPAPAAPPDESALASSGTDLGPGHGILAAALILSGIALLLTARRRRGELAPRGA